MEDPASEVREWSSSRRPVPRLLRAASGKFGLLLVALVALMASTPLILSGSTWTGLLSIFTGAVLVACLHAARPGARSLAVGVSLALTDLAIGRLAAMFDPRWLLVLQALLWLTTLVYVTSSIIESIFEADSVTLETLQASLCIYLLLGLIGAFAFMLVEIGLPGSFQAAHSPSFDLADPRSRALTFMRLFVFSYGTLSGTSYPEITPATGFASNAASLLAMTGQIYLAVVIARLVGLQASPASR